MSIKGDDNPKIDALQKKKKKKRKKKRKKEKKRKKKFKKAMELLQMSKHLWNQNDPPSPQKHCWLLGTTWRTSSTHQQTAARKQV